MSESDRLHIFLSSMRADDLLAADLPTGLLLPCAVLRYLLVDQNDSASQVRTHSTVFSPSRHETHTPSRTAMANDSGGRSLCYMSGSSTPICSTWCDYSARSP
jgi:hypothetical protein